MSIKGGGGEQLKMFMTPIEISGYVESYNDYGKNPEYGKANPQPPDETFDDMDSEYTSDKEFDSVESGMDASIAADGVKKPVGIYHYPDSGPLFVSGHHRLLSQSRRDPNRLMPVLHGHVQRGTFNTGGTFSSDPTGDK
jgi:hypothetical protein